ncbi:peptidoglycan editing factor PgeF [Parachlamydia sp. AcF125]|uniref:peptidoglycan editing factor PgeF n=1 Tax=Parachlamydia sp. AcF125 TaxID=2795736 RepID=UPI001BCA5566|nr:peptidoglycan editing factor PgeF [Parachlamydia sp. AcF125]MBS4167885.1 Polyphenol oxidase [Parachlamydia sp. AcF125]
MLRHQKDGIEWLEFELLADCKNLRHGVLLRAGGFSNAPFTSLNLGLFSTPDERSTVRQNFEKVKHTFQLPSPYIAKQSHGTHIWHIKNLDTYPQKADALVTNESERALFVMHADCQAAIMYDPITQALANVHAGWRGNVQNIFQKTIHYLYSAFGAQPENILVAISPSLGPSNAEFKHFSAEFPPSFWDFQIRPFYFDLWAISQMQLETCGILPHHIQIAKMDTYSLSLDFFSYRRDGITGRNGTFAMLPKKN